MWIPYISPKPHEDYMLMVTERQSTSYIIVWDSDKCYDEKLNV